MAEAAVHIVGGGIGCCGVRGRVSQLGCVSVHTVGSCSRGRSRCPQAGVAGGARRNFRHGMPLLPGGLGGDAHKCPRSHDLGPRRTLRTKSWPLSIALLAWWLWLEAVPVRLALNDQVVGVAGEAVNSTLCTHRISKGG